jgi:hypothetical protein
LTCCSRRPRSRTRTASPRSDGPDDYRRALVRLAAGRVGTTRRDRSAGLPGAASGPPGYTGTGSSWPTAVSSYIGEASKLRRRAQLHRTPGPRQPTNLRVNVRMRVHLTDNPGRDARSSHGRRSQAQWNFPGPRLRGPVS